MWLVGMSADWRAEFVRSLCRTWTSFWAFLLFLLLLFFSQFDSEQKGEMWLITDLYWMNMYVCQGGRLVKIHSTSHCHLLEPTIHISSPRIIINIVKVKKKRCFDSRSSQVLRFKHPIITTLPKRGSLVWKCRGWNNNNNLLLLLLGSL